MAQTIAYCDYSERFSYFYMLKPVPLEH